MLTSQVKLFKIFKFNCHIGLQEVAFGKGGQLDELTTGDDGVKLYEQYNAETQMKFHEVFNLSPDFRIDGNSIIAHNDLKNKAKVRLL